MSTRGMVGLGLLVVAALGSWYLARKYAPPADEQIEREYEHRGYYLKSVWSPVRPHPRHRSGRHSVV